MSFPINPIKNERGMISLYVPKTELDNWIYQKSNYP